jgi:lipoprotein-anchoring transpeptidase ErfK/SrfK
MSFRAKHSGVEVATQATKSPRPGFQSRDATLKGPPRDPSTPLGMTWVVAALGGIFLSSCATKDADHRVVISVKDQRMALLDRETLVASYPVSTSKYGLGDWPGSRRTPLGEMEVAAKIGDGAAAGAVFKDRRRTGEIVLPDAPGRDPIVTRILWLRGRELQNANAFQRDIYIHGTPEERNIGLPVSYGCVRMRSDDIIELFNIVGPGARVTIVDTPLADLLPDLPSGAEKIAAFR